MLIMDKVMPILLGILAIYSFIICVLVVMGINKLL